MQFPLPLTSMEEFMVRDDYVAYPNSIYGRFRFHGKLDLQAMQVASRIAVARHPLIRCNLRVRRGKYFWVAPGQAEHVKGVFDRQQVNDYPAMPGIDLLNEVGGRVYFTLDEHSTDVTFQVHHACCDGLAALQVIIDWMLAYAQAQQQPEREPQLRSLDQSVLQRRGDFGFGTRAYWSMLHRQAIGLAGVYEFLAHRASELVPGSLTRNQDELPPAYPQAITHEFGTSTLTAHQQAALKNDATTNELLARDLFVAINNWRTTYKLGRDTDWLRVMIPINMRQFGHRRMPAANRVSFISIDRLARDCQDPVGLLHWVRGQMRVIQAHHLDLVFLAMLNAYRRIPGGLRSIANVDRCGATCLLTNLGEPLARVALPKENGKLLVGNMRLEGFDLLAPLRPKTNAAFSVFRYAGKMCLTLNFDPRVLTNQSARGLMNRFVARIQRSIEIE
jgi:hypothetical protein